MRTERFAINALRGVAAQATGVGRENIAVFAADNGLPEKKTVVSGKKAVVRRFGFMVFAAGTTDIVAGIMVDRKKTMVTGINTLVCPTIIMVFAAATTGFAAYSMVGGGNIVVAGAGTMVSRENIMVEETGNTVFSSATLVEETETTVFFLSNTIRASPPEFDS